MSQTRSIVFFGFLSLQIAGCFIASAIAGGTANNLLINKPYSIATPPVATVAAGYLQITNTGNQSEWLLGGSSSVAANVEVHETTMSGDVMKMRKLEEGLLIPAGETVVLKPGSVHLMLMNLTKPLLAGEQLSVTLYFKEAGEVSVLMNVVERGSAGMHGHDADNSPDEKEMDTMLKKHEHGKK